MSGSNVSENSDNDFSQSDLDENESFSESEVGEMHNENDVKSGNNAEADSVGTGESDQLRRELADIPLGELHPKNVELTAHPHRHTFYLYFSVKSSS